MNYIAHIVSSGDTLEIIAYSNLGTFDTSEIIAINNLRYPYISDDPKNQYAHEKGTLYLTAQADAGSSSIPINNLNSLQINPYDTIFIQDWTTGKYEAAVVASSSGTTVNLQSELQNSYGISANVSLFSNQENVITKVAQTGDTIYLPVGNQGFTINASSLGDFYGTDIKVDGNFFLAKTQNDLDVISGVANVQQSVALRWMTPVGTLPLEDWYGNPMFSILGELSEPYFWDLAKAYANQSAMSDSRVESVSVTSITATDDTIIVNADVTPSNSSQTFSASTVLSTS